MPVKGLKGHPDFGKVNYTLIENKILPAKSEENISEPSIPQPPIAIDFSKEWHKEIINHEEVGGEIVNYTQEGIPKWNEDFDNGTGYKITLKAGETKYLRIPLTLGNQAIIAQLMIYVVGDITITAHGSWQGTSTVANVPNEWQQIMFRLASYGGYIKLTSTNGGTVYISNINLYHLSLSLSELSEIGSYPNQSLDGTTTYTYYIGTPVFGDTLLRVSVYIAGDGTNPINVSVKLNTLDGAKEIATISRISSTFSLSSVYIPLSVMNYYKIPFAFIILEVSGNGTFKRYALTRYNLGKIEYLLNGLKTASASNASTTVTRYTLIDNNGRGNRYKNAKVVLDGTYGTAILYINGKQVADFSGSSGTFTIPEDLDIWKIEVDLAGDGTNASSASFEGLELLGKYIASR